MIRMILTLKVAALALLMGCATTSSQRLYSINLQSFECMGDCPAYKVRIDNDRKLIFEGISNAKVGVSKFKISKSEYQDLSNVLDQLVNVEENNQLLMSELDAGGKALLVMADGKEMSFMLDNDKPRMNEVEIVLNQILSSRGLID